MEITFLGTAGCIPTEDRGLSAVLLDFLGELFLFDCGEGTQRQMRCFGVNFMRLGHIFLTHLHADHYLGLGGMIQSMEFLERDRDLHIYGPQDTKRTIEGLLSLGTFNLSRFKVVVHEVGLGLVLDEEKYQVTAASTRHTKNSIAYRFEEKPHRIFQKQKALDLGIPEGPLFSKLQKGQKVKVKDKSFSPDDVLSEPIEGRKMVYTGDTRVCKNIIDFAQGVDVLIHDSTYSAEDEEKLLESHHSTCVQAAQAAAQASVGKLYLTHFSQRYTDVEVLVEQARKEFEQTYAAYDGLKVVVDKHW